jgi:hypothetical protein
VPYESSCLDKLAVIRTLKTYARKRKPGMSLGVEILSDMVGPASDYIHSVFYGFNHPESETVEPIGTSRHFPEMFRYTFPEIVISDRGIYDDDDVERRVNRSIALGLRSDVAVFRCRATLAETPRYREYLRKANELRGRFGDFLLRGRYRDRIDGAVDNPFVAARGFENGKRLALVLMHEKRGTVETSLALPGYRLTEHATLGAADARALSCGKTRVRLGRNGLLVAIFEPVSGRARAAPPPRIARAGTGLR